MGIVSWKGYLTVDPACCLRCKLSFVRFKTNCAQVMHSVRCSRHFAFITCREKRIRVTNLNLTQKQKQQQKRKQLNNQRKEKKRMLKLIQRESSDFPRAQFIFGAGNNCIVLRYTCWMRGCLAVGCAMPWDHVIALIFASHTHTHTHLSKNCFLIEFLASTFACQWGMKCHTHTYV